MYFSKKQEKPTKYLHKPTNMIYEYDQFMGMYYCEKDRSQEPWPHVFIKVNPLFEEIVDPIDLNKYIFKTIGGEFGVDAPDISDTVLDYFSTKKEAMDFLKDWMDKRYPKIKYISILN